MNPTVLDVGIPSLDVLLAVAAMLLGLALIVQVVQEIFKYLSNSKARVYQLVLRDYFGPWIDQLYTAGPATRFQVRGPFQFFKSRPTGVLLPLSKEELLEAMDAVAPDWIGHTLEALKNERRLQPPGGAAPSPNLATLVANLRSAADRERVHSNAHRMLNFLTEWGVIGKSRALRREVDANRVLEGLYQRFFPDRVRTEQEFGQLERNYDHAYKRRNLRYTFLFALLIAILLNFPFDTLYRRASQLSPQQAAELTQAMIDADDRLREGDPEVVSGAAPRAERRELVRSLVEQISVVTASPERQSETATPRVQRSDTVAAPDEAPLYRRGLVAMSSAEGFAGVASYFVNCLITALLVSFGAPFWHRLSESLLNIGRRGSPARQDEEV